MPKGISESFLRLLEAERPRAVRAIAAALALALVALALADLADPPRFGRDSRWYVGALAAGVALGALWAGMQARRLVARLKDGWSHTMRDAAHAETLAALDRRLRGAGSAPGWGMPVAAVLFAVANLALFALLWVDAPIAPAASLVVLAGDGLALGAWLGAAGYRWVFARAFVREVDTMVSRGTIGVWGEA